MPEKPPAPKHTYWRGDTLWARFTIGGLEYRESLRTSSAKVAARRVVELRDKAIGRAKFSETTRSWHEAFIAWSAYIPRQVGSPRTAARYTLSLLIAGQHFGALAISEIDKDAVNKFVAARRRSIVNGRGTEVTNATIRRDLQALSSLLDFAEDEGWREGNPALDKMRRLKEHRDPIMLPDEEDYQFLLSRLAAGHAEMLRAARATGMRQNELATAERKHFNRANRSLLVRGKGNKQRTISLSAEAAAIFERQPVSISCPYVFHHKGKAITKAPYIFSRATRAARAAAQRADRHFRGFRFHDMRHLYAVEFLRKGGSIYVLKEHLRHSSVKTTEMYLEFLTPEEAEAAKRGRLDEAARVREEGGAPVVTNDGT
ncbi:site-specific integrase [Xanthobacter autotrophicus]|uniref:tyrosine-type recombinase/integrase n=1 Tax=Xanthobacter autotrophicus TaxID=280 RepID=UPI00372A68C5